MDLLESLQDSLYNSSTTTTASDRDDSALLNGSSNIFSNATSSHNSSDDGSAFDAAQRAFLEEANGSIVTSTDSDIVRETLRLYGSIYAAAMILYTILRHRYPKLFNVRSWARAHKSKLAQQLDEYSWIDWFWKVFGNATDDQLLDECGLDAVCFLRALQFGRRLCLLGAVNAVWLVPLYRTAPSSEETDYLQDGLVLISIANLPAQSPRFSGTVVAAYLTYLYAMYLIFQEFQWFTCKRHKFLSAREPRNYAVYVSGIPESCRSSHQLENYFRQCSGNDSSVLEAHIGRDTPELDALVAKRARRIAQLEHAAAVERRTGRTARHTRIRWRRASARSCGSMARRRFRVCRRRGDSDDDSDSDDHLMERVETVQTLQQKVHRLNRTVQRRIAEVMAQSSRRGGLSRSDAQLDLLQAIQEDAALGSREERDDSDNSLLSSGGNGASGGNNERGGGWTVPNAAAEAGAEATPQSASPVVVAVSPDEPKVHPESKKCAAWDDGGAAYLTKEDEKKSMDEMDHRGPFVTTATSTTDGGDIEAVTFDHNNSNNNTPAASGDAERLERADPALEMIQAMIDPFVPSPMSGRHNNRYLQPQFDSEPPEQQPTDPVEQQQEGDADDHALRLYEDYDDDSNNLRETILEDEPLTESAVDDEDFDNDLGRNEIMMEGDVEEGMMVIHPSRAFSEQASSDGLDPQRQRQHNSDGALPSESVRSGWSTASSSKGSSSGSGRRHVSQTIRRSVATGSRTFNKAGTSLQRGSRAAGTSITKGSQAVSSSIAKKSHAVGTSLAKGSQAATQAMGSSAEWLVQNVGERGNEALKKANKVGTNLVTSASAVVPALLLNKEEGKARDAGFVVFTNLYAVQTALQMIHHPKPYVMEVTPAGSPSQIFWRNVGLPHRAKRGGMIAAFVASAVLCFFWSVPMAFVSSLTEVNSLKESLPKLGQWIEDNPWLENVFAQLAPMLMLFLNEGILPVVLKYFGTWEGHISDALLEASLFTKMGCFMIIQTFFVSAISGSISAEITNILENPDSVIEFLANALPSQGYFFVQIALAQTFVLQAIETLRIYPLGLALLRRCIGPRLTAKERRKSFGWLRSLDEPPDFWHAETFAQLILFYMVYFVYAPITPIVPVFLCFCFLLCESGYRYQFIHNYPRSFETGGVMWRGFIKFILASMVIAQLTLIGLLGLKKSEYTVALIPLIIITGLFIIFINSKHSHVSNFLPTRDCILIDSENRIEGEMDMDFVRGAYLQPSLQKPIVNPDFDEGKDDYLS